MSKLDTLHEDYRKFILERLYNQESFNNDDIELFYNLHNTHVSPMNPQFNRRCSSCYNRTLRKVRDFYREDLG